MEEGALAGRPTLTLVVETLDSEAPEGGGGGGGGNNSSGSSRGYAPTAPPPHSVLPCYFAPTQGLALIPL